MPQLTILPFGKTIEVAEGSARTLLACSQQA